ncbi:peptidoglycan-binding protein [Bradyrhizobium sp. DN5]|uniref:peptidoglycan-binding protein n=1 Tax=Bradyrhizobium sp. DN5 TaxID=3056950 RepID=UPI003525CF78
MPVDGAGGPLVTEPGRHREPLTFERRNYIGGPNLYAGHRSHSSHSSRSSHSSHYLGSGGSHSYPAAPPVPDVATSPAIAPPPTPTMPSALGPRPEKPEIVVMRVQLELKARKLYAGPIDGRISQELRDALRAFQILQRLPGTGTMDNLTLAKLGTIY